MPSGLLPEHPLHGRQGEQAGAPYPALWDTMVEEELRAVAPRIASEVPAAIPVTNRANEATVPVKLEPHAHGTLLPEEQIQGGISGGKTKSSRRRK